VRVIAEAEHAHGHTRVSAHGRLERTGAGDEEDERGASCLRRPNRSEGVLARLELAKEEPRDVRVPETERRPGRRPMGRVMRHGRDAVRDDRETTVESLRQERPQLLGLTRRGA
jgi:hypothetical protein